MVGQGGIRMLAGILGMLLLPLHGWTLGPGDLDTSFGGTGMVSIRNTVALAVALQSDGKIIAAGQFDDDLGLTRWLSNGTLDPTFGNQGIVQIDIGNYSDTIGRFSVDRFTSLTLQPDGKMVVAGVADSVLVYNVLMRFLANGTIDSSFGNQGLVLTDFITNALALQPDGKMVLAGNDRGYQGCALARYRSNGTLDPSFGNQGIVTTEVGRVCSYGALALQPDSKMVAAGRSYATSDAQGAPLYDLVLARYRSNGTLDPTFGNQGITLTHVGNGRIYNANDVVLQPDGKIVVVGNLVSGGVNSYPALERYRPNGTLDPTFGTAGTVRGNGTTYAAALAMQPHDGRLVVAGSITRDDPEFTVWRYHAITCHGVVVTQIGTAGNDTIIGTPGPDVIFGFAGDDTISGRGGNDLLCGGSGNDTLYGGGGDDILSGGSGMDTCAGGGQVSGDQAVECEQVTNVP